MTNNTNRPSLSGAEDGSGGGGKHNVNTGILGAVTAAATAFSTDAQRVNTQGQALLNLANETLPNQAERIGAVETKRSQIMNRLASLDVRIGQLGHRSVQTPE